MSNERTYWEFTRRNNTKLVVDLNLIPARLLAMEAAHSYAYWKLRDRMPSRVYWFLLGALFWALFIKFADAA